VGWLGPGSAVGMVWYGIGKCIAGFVVYFFFLSKLCVVSYLSYIYFTLSIFYYIYLYELLVVAAVGADGSESDHILSPTLLELTLALDLLV